MSVFGHDRDHDHDIDKRLDRIDNDIRSLTAECDLILKVQHRILELLTRLPTGMAIDILGDHMSTVAGTTSNFQEVYTPAGSAPPAGTTQTWTVDVADITLTPSADGTTCQAAVPATETATSYNLTCTSSYTPPGAPTPISATLNVPIVPSTPAPTGMVISQLS